MGISVAPMFDDVTMSVSGCLSLPLKEWHFGAFYSVERAAGLLCFQQIKGWSRNFSHFPHILKQRS